MRKPRREDYATDELYEYAEWKYERYLDDLEEARRERMEEKEDNEQ